MAVRLDHCILVFGGTWGNNEPLSNCVICMYNLYTEQWTTHLIKDTDVPPPCSGASATLIGVDIYMFGGETIPQLRLANALWKLNKTPTRGFVWCEIKQQSKGQSPSPRYMHSAWEYGRKLWIFGGDTNSIDGYLNDNGDTSEFENNQVLCFNPSQKEWTNPMCSGNIPEPRSQHATAIIRDKAWLYGGLNLDYIRAFDDLYQLDMDSLTWTEICTSEKALSPGSCISCTLTAVTEDYLVMHGGVCHASAPEFNTWIFNVTSASWRIYLIKGKDKQDDKRFHSCALRINHSTVIITGGELLDWEHPQPHEPLQDINITLKPKSLEHLAMQTIYKNQKTLPWQMLPKKLLSLFEY